MTTLLATKQDLGHLEQLTAMKFKALDDRLDAAHENLDLRLQGLESRVVIKLSVVMAALVAAAGTLLAFAR